MFDSTPITQIINGEIEDSIKLLQQKFVSATILCSVPAFRQTGIQFIYDFAIATETDEHI